MNIGDLVFLYRFVTWGHDIRIYKQEARVTKKGRYKVSYLNSQGQYEPAGFPNPEQGIKPTRIGNFNQFEIVERELITTDDRFLKDLLFFMKRAGKIIRSRI